MNITPHINQTSITSVREWINAKKGSTPFYATQNNVENVVTDMDHFPYTRYYRGVYSSEHPIVIEREAGYRPIEDECYTPKIIIEKTYPDHCFEPACSTVYPCFESTSKHAQTERKRNEKINGNCNVMYR